MRIFALSVKRAPEWNIVINAVESGTNPFGCTDYLNQKKKICQTESMTWYLGRPGAAYQIAGSRRGELEHHRILQF